MRAHILLEKALRRTTTNVLRGGWWVESERMVKKLMCFLVKTVKCMHGCPKLFLCTRTVTRFKKFSSFLIEVLVLGGGNGTVTGILQ